MSTFWDLQASAGGAGTSILWRGEWLASLSYNPNDAVSKGINSYISLTNNSGIDPATDGGTNWGSLAKGGPPNVLTVQSTTTSAPGGNADVVISGTSPAQSLAFTIPRGEAGPQGVQGFGLPVGATIDWPGATEPAGWIFAFGQAISRTVYSVLFAAYGTIHGAGDGSTTFNVPDLRGRTVAGRDDMGGVNADRLNGSMGASARILGAVGGADMHTLTEAQMPNHSHSYSSFYGSGNLTAYSGSQKYDSAVPRTEATGGNQPHNNLQPTSILNKIIFTGV